MAFTTDYSNVKTSGPVPEGRYEVVFDFVGTEYSQNTGKTYVSIVLTIRNDLSQPYANRKLYDTMWPLNNPSAADKNCGDFSSKRINSMSMGAGLPSGVEYASIEEWCGAFADRVCKVEVKHETYKGKESVRVKYYNPTGHPVNNHNYDWTEDGDEEEYREEEVVETVVVISPTEDDIPFAC